MMRIIVVAASLSFSSAFLSACSVLFFTGSSEENLVCGPDNGSPRCLEGFACVRAADNIDRCVRANFKGIGEACIATDECQQGALCADAYAELCPNGSDDINCSRAADTGLQCRAGCDSSAACRGDERCFFFDIGGFCQSGTCATDTDCGNGSNAFCVGEKGDNSRTGFCFEACDPLACLSNGQCPCGAGESCQSPPDEGVSTRNICGPAGPFGVDQLCAPQSAEAGCLDGFTCAPRNVGDSLCVQWCRVGGGAPACDVGFCQNLVQGAALGICQ